MDVLQDVFALFVIFAVTLVIVLFFLSIATSCNRSPAGPGHNRGTEESNTQPEAAAYADEAARQLARQAAQEQETGEV